MKLFVLYNKQEYEINLLHDYNENINDNWNEQEKNYIQKVRIIQMEIIQKYY